MPNDRPPRSSDGIPVLGDETAPIIPYRLTFDWKRGVFPSIGLTGGEVEQQYEIPDAYLRVLFHALCCKHRVMFYRRPGQPAEIICVRASIEMHDSILWPEYLELSAPLEDEVVTRAIEYVRRRVPGVLPDK